MDVREKLVELLNDVQETGVNEIPAGFGCTREYIANEKVASHLTDHGVTVHEWIPVAERLPENFISVLGYMTDAEEFPPVRECYTVGNAFFFPALGDVHPVSHWCEMPEPPKGE